MSFGPDDSGLLDFKSESEAIAYLEELGLKFKYGCHREGNAVQCHSLGRWYENFKHNYSEAETTFRKNCFNRRFAESCTKYAFYKMFGGEGVKRDSRQAFEALKFGCHVAEDARCCQTAGELIVDGVVTMEDRKLKINSAMEYFRRGCDKGLPVSCYYLGGLLLKCANMQRDADIKEAGSINQPRSQAEVALRKDAVLAWARACETGGHELACRNVARAYRLGDGVERNDKLATEYARKAAPTTTPSPQ